MVVYEVNLDVDREILGAWLPWLAEHVDAMLAISGFEGAEVLRRQDVSSDTRASFSVQYRLTSMAALDRYLAEDAARMRADGERRFGGQFAASRRILEPMSRQSLSEPDR